MSRTLTFRLDEALWQELSKAAANNRSQFAREALEEKLARTRKRKFRCLEYAGTLRLPASACSSAEWLKKRLDSSNDRRHGGAIAS